MEILHIYLLFVVYFYLCFSLGYFPHALEIVLVYAVDAGATAQRSCCCGGDRIKGEVGVVREMLRL